jgi:cytochrome c-type biogenesis protein CcmH
MNPFWTVSLFWIAVVVCLVIALAFVLPPLLRTRAAAGRAARRDINIAVYRDQLREIEADRASGMLSEAQFQVARQELEARLADDVLSPDASPEPGQAGSRSLGYGLAAVLPVAALGLYFWLGQPASLVEMAAAQSAPSPSATASPAALDFAQLAQRVEERTRSHPDDGEAWAMLGKTYAAMEQWAKALPALEKAMELLPREASVLSGYAEALAVTNNRVLAGRPMEWVRQALAVDPDDMKGLELAAIHAYQEGRHAEAAAYFGRLYALLLPETAYAQDILAAQQEAERLARPGMAGLDSLASPPSAAAPGASAAAGATIQGRVDIDPALKSRLADTDVLFLFARPGQSGPPVAAMRLKAGQLPLEFELDDSMAMTPGNALSQHSQATLVARVSKSGSPGAQPGDLEGSLAGVAVGARGVKLLIDRVLP